MAKPDVHTDHCCKRHGCKYNDKKCTVVTGKKQATHNSCEGCELDAAELRYRYNELKRLVDTTSEEIDRNLNPKVVKRIGSIELTLSFDDEEPSWYASFSYKFARRASSQKITTHDPKTSQALALEDLLETVKAAKTIGAL